MRLGEMLGLDAQKAMTKKASAIERAVEKNERKAREAEQNRRRSRGEIVRYPERDRR